MCFLMFIVYESKGGIRSGIIWIEFESFWFWVRPYSVGFMGRQDLCTQKNQTFKIIAGNLKKFFPIYLCSFFRYWVRTWDREVKISDICNTTCHTFALTVPTVFGRMNDLICALSFWSILFSFLFLYFNFTMVFSFFYHFIPSILYSSSLTEMHKYCIYYYLPDISLNFIVLFLCNEKLWLFTIRTIPATDIINRKERFHSQIPSHPHLRSRDSGPPPPKCFPSTDPSPMSNREGRRGRCCCEFILLVDCK